MRLQSSPHMLDQPEDRDVLAADDPQPAIAQEEAILLQGMTATAPFPIRHELLHLNPSSVILQRIDSGTASADDQISKGCAEQHELKQPILELIDSALRLAICEKPPKLPPSVKINRDDVARLATVSPALWRPNHLKVTSTCCRDLHPANRLVTASFGKGAVLTHHCACAFSLTYLQCKVSFAQTESHRTAKPLSSCYFPPRPDFPGIRTTVQGSKLSLRGCINWVVEPPTTKPLRLRSLSAAKAAYDAVEQYYRQRIGRGGRYAFRNIRCMARRPSFVCGTW